MMTATRLTSAHRDYVVVTIHDLAVNGEAAIIVLFLLLFREVSSREVLRRSSR